MVDLFSSWVVPVLVPELQKAVGNYLVLFDGMGVGMDFSLEGAQQMDIRGITKD